MLYDKIIFMKRKIVLFLAVIMMVLNSICLSGCNLQKDSDNVNLVVQVEFSDGTIGTVTLVNDERIRFTYGDLILIYDI